MSGYCQDPELHEFRPCDCPSEAEINKALKAVELYGILKYPVGAARAHLCHAAVILAAAYSKAANRGRSEAIAEAVNMLERRSTEGYWVNLLAKSAIIDWVKEFSKP